MFKFIFSDTENDEHARNIQYTVPDTDYTIDQLLEHYMSFLKAVGYQFPSNAQLVVGEDETIYTIVTHPMGGDECCGKCAGQKEQTNDKPKFPISDS